MNRTNLAPQITLRIPGDWSHPGELRERLPPGFRLAPETLFLPDDTPVEFTPMPPDGEFPQVFQSACRRPPQENELAVIAHYTANVCLSGSGGSLESARRMMQAGAAIVRAGGAGVFIDNSLLAHGGNDWIEMTDDGGPDAISFAFASIVRGRQEVYTIGMQTMGLPDLLMHPSDIGEQGDAIVEVIRYVCDGGQSIDVGHMLAIDPRTLFQVVGRTSDNFAPHSPMHNPLGRLRIMSQRNIAAGN